VKAGVTTDPYAAAHSCAAPALRITEAGGTPLADGVDVTTAEVAVAVRHEGALTPDDVLHRRTQIGLVAADAEACRARVEAVMQ
jgi:glycerol-3-phosphate dehydrogenase